MPFGVNKLTGRPGPAPIQRRSGDKRQARALVNRAIRRGEIANPNTLPCTDCGHQGADRRHEYDHHLGYEAEYFLAVQAVCTICHAARDSAKKNATHCLRGHEYTTENTITKKNGTRQCRQCTQAKDRGRRDAAYWRAYRQKRKAANGG